MFVTQISVFIENKKGESQIMSLHGKDIKIFAGNASKHVAAQMARELGLPVGNSDVITFSDGEISVSIKESVRGSDVFVVQSTCCILYTSRCV